MPLFLPSSEKVLNVQTNTVSLSSNGDGHTYSLPAGTLARDGDFLEIEAWGATTGTVSMTIQLVFGATFLTTPMSTAVTFRLRGRVFRTGATSQDTYAQRLVGTTVANATSTLSQTLANAITIKTEITSYSTGTVNFEGITIKYSRAP